MLKEIRKVMKHLQNSLCPYVRKFYWSEEEISLLEKEKEDKPLSYNRNVDENHFEQELMNLQNSKDS
ncbi:hypothetical protein Anas_05552 [Armadillidium nasatum]|uniref:Uncharacterized protein n=1 Tax=Armadillidium nasatum TaxID=96803 RepID=A0A5N5SXA3_9CRUS|nr:hypothetical protein Anas_05552 [Armadillidium nasatum]